MTPEAELTFKATSAEQMNEGLTFIKPSAKAIKIEALSEKVPLLSGYVRHAVELLGSVDSLGDAVTQLFTAEKRTSHALQAASSGVQFAGLTLSIIDFFRIPAIYLGAAIVGEKPPITLSRNVQWLYSGVTLGLTIAALAIPIAAPPIAIALAGLGLGVSIATMAKTVYHRYKAPKELKLTEETIEEESKRLHELHEKALDLEKKIHLAEAENTSPEELMKDREELEATLTEFNTTFSDKKETLQTLYNKKIQCEALLEKHDTPAVMDKGIGIALSALALTGLTLSLFFPPLGFALLTASAVAGASYIVSRTLFPIVKEWVTKLFNKKTETQAITTPEEQTTVSVSPENQQEILNTADVSLNTEAAALPTESHTDIENADQSVPESTTTTMKLLYGEQGAPAALLQQITENHSVDEMKRTLLNNIEANRFDKLLTDLSQVPTSIQTATYDDLTQFFSNFDEEEQDKLFASLNHAISAVHKGELNLSEETIAQLFSSEPLVEFLHEQGVEVQKLVENRPALQANAEPGPTEENAPDEPQQM